MSDGADLDHGTDERARSPFRSLWIFSSVLTVVGLFGSVAGQIMSASANYGYTGTQPFPLTFSQILWSVSPTLLTVGVFGFGFGILARAVLAELRSRERVPVAPGSADASGGTASSLDARASASVPTSFAPPVPSEPVAPAPRASWTPTPDDHARFKRPDPSRASASERV